MELGERIMVLRHRHGWTQQQLGTKVGLNKMTIWRLENGTIHEVKSRALGNLAQTLGVSADYLLGLSESEEPSHA